jgi:hypothetical protein
MIDTNKIKDFIRGHDLIQKMTKDLKELKVAKRTLELDIAKSLSENNIEVIDSPNVRIYRYDKRLVLYRRNNNEF